MKAKDIVAHLEEIIGIVGPPTRLVEAIGRTLLDFGLPEIQAVENAELLEQSVRDLIFELEDINPSPILAIVNSAEHLVAGFCYIHPSDNSDVIAAKRSRLNIYPLLQEMRDLTPDEFELFGACVLKELGAKQVWVTPRSNDQGIDFYGILSLGQNSLLPTPFGQLAHDVNVMFAGQAKHYAQTNPVGPEFIRELVGSVSLARHQISTANKEIFDQLKLLPYNPLVVMFFTTGVFTRGALELAERSGVVAKSGDQLAVFLADRRVGMYDDNGTMKFDKALFHNWLSTSSS